MTGPPILQHPAEFEQLLALYRERRPRRVLEVGTHLGGTLYHWLREAPPGATVVAVDDQHQAAGNYDAWLHGDTTLVAIRGNSGDPLIAAEAAGYAPYDWIFIDADHHDPNVRADWQLYRPLAAPEAVIAFHDVKPSPDPTIEVDGLWAELAADHDTIEYDAGQGTPGIGVVFLPALEAVEA